jgi:hypothetical protein
MVPYADLANHSFDNNSTFCMARDSQRCGCSLLQLLLQHDGFLMKDFASLTAPLARPGTATGADGSCLVNCCSCCCSTINTFVHFKLTISSKALCFSSQQSKSS